MFTVLAVCLIALFASGAANLPGKYSDAENNESTTFLPGDAESTKVLGIIDELEGGEQAPIVIVYRREGGLTPQDEARMAADRDELNRAIEEDEEGFYGPVTPFGEPRPSQSGGAGVLIGGPTAIEYDVRRAAARDTRVIIPIALVVVLGVLIVLLRALFAPLLLVGTVILSFGAALGISLVVFDVIFGFAGVDPSVPLFAFIFLVALGIDYNIFLMARVREETQRHGTRQGMLRGLAVTGGAITSTGIVLAGTFSVLALLPLVFLTEIGFVIAFGVLLDTFLVRSVLVPALVLDAGPRVWWPSRLAKTDGSVAQWSGPGDGEPGEPGPAVHNGRPAREAIGER